MNTIKNGEKPAEVAFMGSLMLWRDDDGRIDRRAGEDEINDLLRGV